jgi:hypothetical protein
MAWRMGSAVAVVLMSLLIVTSAAVAQGAVSATLSVVAAPVERIAAGGNGAEPGVNGMNLGEGDRIKTGADGIALITFLNGSTVTVLSDSEVTVKQATAGRGRSGMRVLIHAGRVWARVVQAAGARSNLALESNDYTATAHDGLIGAERSAEGFVCWTRRGNVHLTNSLGQTEAVLMAGQRAWARLRMPVTPEPFVASASVLEIRSTGPVLPLVRMPDGRLAAGFLADDVEVNQVFGALTEAGRGQRWLVEVPGGHDGPYTLILTGAGAFTVRVSARYAGFPVYRQEITGTIRPGERLFTRINQSVKGEDPRTARVREASVESLRAWDHGEPAVVASPADGPRPGAN